MMRMMVMIMMMMMMVMMMIMMSIAVGSWLTMLQEAACLLRQVLFTRR